jgi:hypothetical protein
VLVLMPLWKALLWLVMVLMCSPLPELIGWWLRR